MSLKENKVQFRKNCMCLFNCHLLILLIYLIFQIIISTFNLSWKQNRQRLTPKTYEEVCCSLRAPRSSEEKGKHLASSDYLAFGPGD